MDSTNKIDAGPLEREPLKDLECEKLVLASLMSSTLAMTDTRELLDDDCFHDVHHQEIFAAIREVFDRGENPDLVTVPAQLAKKGSLITPVQVMDLCFGFASSGDLSPYAMRLKDLSLRRKLWETGYRLLDMSTQEIKSVEEIQSFAKDGIDNLFQSVKSQFSTLGEVYSELQERMLINMNLDEGSVYGTPTGFYEIDRRGGLVGGDLIVIGAETSQGKTSFANALALSAIKAGHAVAFYSMEMSPVQLNARIASMLTGISARRIMYEKMTINEIYAVDNAMKTVDSTKMLFDGRSVTSLDSILISLRSMKSKYDIKGAAVDYLQLVNVSGERLNREQSVARIARELKNIAKELDIWILAISQLSRDQKNPMPTMSRLRDSGQIEEAADNIFLIYRILGNGKYPEPFQDIPTKGTALITIGKGRNVGIGQFVCGFNPDNTFFYPLTKDDIENLKFSNSIMGQSFSEDINEIAPF